MAAPFTIVTFEDAEGDEFPIRVEGTWTTGERPKLIVQARKQLGEFVAAGNLRPTEPLTKARVEIRET